MQDRIQRDRGKPRQFAPASPFPAWKQVFVWIGVTVGIVLLVPWVCALVSVSRWKEGRNPEPYWAWEYGLLVTVVAGLAGILTLAGI